MAMLVKVVWNRPVRCPNWEQGCAWTIILGQDGANLATINQHVAECPHRVVKCQWAGCKQTGPREKIAQHEKECPLKTGDVPPKSETPLMMTSPPIVVPSIPSPQTAMTVMPTLPTLKRKEPTSGEPKKKRRGRPANVDNKPREKEIVLDAEGKPVEIAKDENKADEEEGDEGEEELDEEAEMMAGGMMPMSTAVVPTHYQIGPDGNAIIDPSQLGTALTGEGANLPFRCEHPGCGACFGTKDRLQLHGNVHTDGFNLERQRTLTGDKPYKCSVCGRAFTAMGNLNVHMRSHVAKSFKCNQCSKAFSKLTKLQSHMRTHTNEEPFKCTECDMVFPAMGNLTVHMRRHTGEKPFKCTDCEKAFTTSTNLRTHQRTHTGEKPYKCTMCDKTFAAMNSWTVHMRTHTGERPYKCQDCDKAFTQSSDLRRHERRRHPTA